MRVIVSDGTCLANLEKTSLLDAAFNLPYDFEMVDTLLDHVALGHAATFRQRGLQIVELSGKMVLLARQLMAESPLLSVNDSFSVVMASRGKDSVLLTEEPVLREFATDNGISLGCTLWLIDEMSRWRVATRANLALALRLLAEDPQARLQRQQLPVYLQRYS